MSQINYVGIGAMLFAATVAANAAGEAVSDERASVAQQVAQLFADGAVEVAQLNEVADGYAQAAKDAGTKSGAVTASTLRKMAQHRSILTYKRDEDTGAVLAFGHGSLRKEYAAVNYLIASAFDKLATRRAALAKMEADFADAKRILMDEIAVLNPLVLAELTPA